MRVMVPPEGMRVTGEKVRVTDTQDKRAIRSDEAMANETDDADATTSWNIVIGTLNHTEYSLTLVQ